MIQRPKPGENEDDILKMQEEFLREKSKNQNLQPAAQVVNLRHNEPTKRSNPESSVRKPSKYAQSKGLKNHGEKRVKIDETPTVIGDIIEKNTEEKETEIEDDKVYYPKIIQSILGNIVEKNTETLVNTDIEFKPLQSGGFPIATKRDPSIVPGKKSIHSQQLEKEKQNSTFEMELEESFTYSAKESNEIDLPSKSYILSSEEADHIHNENIKLLSKMSENQILEERQKLLSGLDPSIVEFIKAKRTQVKINPNITQTKSVQVDEKIQKINHDDNNALNDQSMDTSEPKSDFYDSLWENDILSHPEITQWLHFDSLERDKLEWIKGIEESKKVKSDQPYEARFDFKGYLLPYTIDYNESTKTLFQHGEEPHRPGYSLIELIELSRSSVTQQRVMALNTIAGILEYNGVGTYKDILEIPLTKVFFIIRIAMDENKIIILEPALKALRNLLYNRIDEASLDALMGFEEGMIQPCLENDKSEIEELESQESELNDYHLAEIDLIAALMRTDILQRLYYIVDTVKPTFNCIHYCLQILTRLARDSVETAHKIVSTEQLMKSITGHFLPATGINFVFDPNIVYNGKPILAALKLTRILSLQSREIGDMLITKYAILKPISDYISSAVDRSYGLRIQIEAYCILTNLLNYGLCIHFAVSLSPVILTSLYKHVQGTNIDVKESMLSSTHAAVILQLINRLLRYKFNGNENVVTQIYPLLKEGVHKWVLQLAQSSTYTCGHLKPLCAVLDCFQTVLSIEKVPVKFLTDDLSLLSSSNIFQSISNNIILTSNLLSGLENKNIYYVKNLVTLRSSIIDSDQKVLPTLNMLSVVPFLGSLLKLLVVINNNEISGIYLKLLNKYMTKLASHTPSLSENWFTRMEIDLIFNIIHIGMQSNVSETDKDLLYAVSNRHCYILRIDKKYELEFLFENIVFNKNWFTAERLLNLINLSESDGFAKALTSINDIKKCYSTVVNINYVDKGPNVVFQKWMEPILPRDWIYLPILMLYAKSQEPEGPKIVGEHAQRVEIKRNEEIEFIITCSLEWIIFNEMCFPDLLHDIDVTDRFCRIMCVFLCNNSLFLEANIKNLLQKATTFLFKQKTKFDFDKQLTGLNNFQDFYTQLLEQFQSVSYGDQTFAACVLVPLAQQHNVKWRKLLWSEYAGCLRALDCPEVYLCYDMKDYLYPEETDESLIKSYFQALSSSLLRPKTIAYRIALHHVNSFKKRNLLLTSK